MGNKTVKAHIVLPKELLDDVKREAGPRKRSRFIAEAIREKLERLKGSRAFRRAAGSWSDEEYHEFRTLQDVDRFLRKLRSSAVLRAPGAK